MNNNNNNDDDNDYEDDDKRMRPIYPTAGEQRCLRMTQCGCAIVLLIVGIILIILAAATNQTGLIVQTYSAFRTGPNTANTSLDAFPALELTPLGTVDVSLFYAFATIFGAIGFALSWFMNRAEIGEIAGGSDGYMWASFILSHILLWEAILLTLGVAELTALIFGGILVFAWLALLWTGGQLNQIFYRVTMRERSGGSTWSWAFYVFVLVVFVPYVILIYVHAFFTYGGTHGTPPVPSTAPALDLIPPIIATLLYIAFFIVLALHYANVSFIRSTTTYVIAMYVINGILLFFVPIIAVVLFAFDTVAIAE